MELPAGCAPQEVHVFCSVNYNGLIRFPRACMKSIEAEDATASPPAAQATQGVAAAGDEQSHTEGQESAGARSPAPSPPKVKVTELRVLPLLYPGRLTEDDLRAYREMELQMDNEDRLYREKQDRLNELETLVYAIRDGLADSLGPYASDAEKTTLGKLLEELENWVYDHQDDPEITKSAILAKIDSLKQVSSPIQHRQQQRELRQVAAEKLRATIQVCIYL